MLAAAEGQRARRAPPAAPYASQPHRHLPRCLPSTLQALSDAHTYLFDERERLLALQAENDALRLQEGEDRQRIKQLLSLSRPSEQQVVLQQENAGRPSNLVLPRAPAAGAAAAQHRSTRSPRRAGGEGGERVLRTIYLPAAQTEPLTLKCETLQAQLQEQVQADS